MGNEVSSNCPDEGKSYWNDVLIGFDEEGGPVFYRVYAESPSELREKISEKLNNDEMRLFNQVYRYYLYQKRERPFSNSIIGCVNPFTKEVINSEKEYERYLWMLSRNVNGMPPTIKKSKVIVDSNGIGKGKNGEKNGKKDIAEGKRQTSKENKKKKSIERVIFVLFLFGLPIILTVLSYTYESIYNSGYAEGHDLGYAEGYLDGKEIGYEDGEYDGYNAGYEDGEYDGYNAGYKDAKSVNSSASSKNGNKSSGGGTLVPISVKVYVTDYGSKYHRWGCQYLWDSANAISLSQAISRGYTACSKCW